MVFAAAFAALLRAAPALEVTWAEIEPSDGVFNWTALDAKTFNATAQGLLVSLVCDGSSRA